LKRRSDWVNLTGRKIGTLTVVESIGKTSRHAEERWRCSCDCGREVVLFATRLTRPPPNRCCSRSCPLHPKPDPAAWKVRRSWDSAIRHARKEGLPFHRTWRKFEAFLAAIGTAPEPHAILRLSQQPLERVVLDDWEVIAVQDDDDFEIGQFEMRPKPLSGPSHMARPGRPYAASAAAARLRKELNAAGYIPTLHGSALEAMLEFGQVLIGLALPNGKRDERQLLTLFPVSRHGETGFSPFSSPLPCQTMLCLMRSPN
jgi:hypothetical protein